MKNYLLLLKTTLCFSLLACNNSIEYQVNKVVNRNKPKIAFSVDDGQLEDIGKFKFQTWNQMMLDNLKKNNVKAIFFPSYANKSSQKGYKLMESWNNEGHIIGNHTFNHVDFNDQSKNLAIFKQELLSNEDRVGKYSNFKKIFRFPYLNEGNSVEKLTGFRQILKEEGYKNGHVTIDNTDWYIDLRIKEKLKINPNADISGFKEYYINHVYERAVFYESLSYKLNNRHINHMLLLHHNILGALFLDDLIKHFKNKGWEIVDADVAFKDKIYNTEVKLIPSGQSLIWAMAKSSGKYNDILRYPAEGKQYEQIAMDKMGL